MKRLLYIAFLFVFILMVNSCAKEVIQPEGEEDPFLNTRGLVSTDGDDCHGGGIVDDDDDEDEEEDNDQIVDDEDDEDEEEDNDQGVDERDGEGVQTEG